MFKLFKKDPIKALEKAYEKKMEEARDVQRSGDIKHYAELVAESEEILNEIEKLKNQ
ncbi:MAG: DUF6435 family protein [Bacteroidota bacterium]